VKTWSRNLRGYLLKDIENPKCPMDDFIVDGRNKECAYWFNKEHFGDYHGHGGTHPSRVIENLVGMNSFQL